MKNRIEPKFPVATGGNPCDGRTIFAADGSKIGLLRREFDYVDVGSVQCSYVNKVTGYVVEDWKNDKDHEFKTLKEASAFARSMS